MPDGLVRTDLNKTGIDFLHGFPVIEPLTFGTPVTLPHIIGNPIPVADSTLDSNPVTWIPTPAHFGNIFGATMSILQTAKVTLTAAQIKSGGPITVVPAPGVGNLVYPICAYIRLHFGGVAYASAGGTTMFWTTPAEGTNPLACDPSTLLTQVSDALQFVQQAYQTSGGVAVPIVDIPSDWDNQPLQVGISPAPTLGNGTLDVITFYAIITT